jgi:hypothetical protein
MPKAFWDLEEEKGFDKIKASDGITYNVWDSGTLEEKLEVAETLAHVRKDINKILLYIYNNPQKWQDHPIAWGIYHTFDIHLPGWENRNNFISKENLFEYQEMTPNEHGIIGLNKPKHIISIPVILDGKKINYELTDKRKILLTIRNQRTGKLNGYPTILDLAIHELTHTTCNDVRWKEDNHRPPYQSYHTLMRKWARESGVLN